MIFLQDRKEASTSWEQLNAAVRACQACSLGKARKNTVSGEGNINARIMFVGEGPGAQEDEQGRPFVGAAGQLLGRMLASINLTREQVYIANIVKCRPPGNRVPLPEEAQACLPFLRAQVSLIRPGIIVCLGATAARAIISPDLRITRERGIWVERKGFWLMPTYHPSALLRDVSKKKEAWLDFQAIRDKLRLIQDEN